MAGYSATPLVNKLGYKAGFRVHVYRAPEQYFNLLGELPADICFSQRLVTDLDLVHLFVTSRTDLSRRLNNTLKYIKANGAIWVSWPKKSSRVTTDITEDVIRSVALPLGLVDIKVCAVDEVWSGLKLVIRKQLRNQ